VKFVVIVEGDMEQTAIGPFLKQWLDPKLTARVGVQTVKLKGTRFRRDLSKMVEDQLSRDRRNDIIAVIGLCDLYQGADFPSDKTRSDERYAWGIQHFENVVNSERFHMFFAVHETEAWFLSQPDIFPRAVRDKWPKELSQAPEHVDFNNPPSKRLARLYPRGYRKTTDGTSLLRERLDPVVAREKCPHLKDMLDTMLDLAQNALKEN